MEDFLEERESKEARERRMRKGEQDRAMPLPQH